MTDPDRPTHVLAPGDAVVPAVIHCAQRIPVPGTEGALPPPACPTAAQLHAASARSDLPVWMRRLPRFVVAELSTLLVDLGPIGSTASYAFDAHHRLDDTSFVGQPVGSRVPVLGIRLSYDLLADPSGAPVALHLRRYRADDAAYRDAFSVELRELASFGAPWSGAAHVPALLVEERYRLVSLEAETVVGALAGTLTLLPGERRTIKLSASSERKAAGRSSLSVVEDVGEETKDDFTSEFERQGRSIHKSAARVSWSVAPAGKDLPSPHEREQSWSVEELVETTERTLREATQTRKATTKVTVSREDEQVDVAKVEGSRTLEIVNPSTQCLTLSYHHLNTAYLTHLDLVGLRLVYTGADAGVEPVSVPFGADPTTFLAGLGGDGDARARLHAAVVAFLDARYGALGIGTVVDGRLVAARAPEGDPNDRLCSRAALCGPRRRTGALPLCLSTSTHVVQRATLHAVPHLSEFSLGEGAGAKPKRADLGDGAAFA